MPAVLGALALGGDHASRGYILSDGSVGAGPGPSLGRSLLAGVAAGVALTDGLLTPAGDITIQGRVTVSY
ncbi:hypothetical protein [Xanthobacter sediminis]